MRLDDTPQCLSWLGAVRRLSFGFNKRVVQYFLHHRPSTVKQCHSDHLEPRRIFCNPLQPLISVYDGLFSFVPRYEVLLQGEGLSCAGRTIEDPIGSKLRHDLGFVFRWWFCRFESAKQLGDGIRKGSAIWGPDFIERMESKLKQIALFDSALLLERLILLEGLESALNSGQGVVKARFLYRCR